MTDPSMPKSLYDANSGTLGAFQGVQLVTGMATPLGTPHDANIGALGSNMIAPVLGSPLTWAALASSGVSLEDVFKIMSTQQQLGLSPGFNTGYAGMQQMPQQMPPQMPQMPNSLPSSLMTFPFLASMTGATNDPMPQNRDMARASFAEDSQSGIWRAATGYETQVSVMLRSKGVDRRVLLTRELLSTYFHESLDTVAEKMLISKTTIKAACRRLGLVKWPYRHSGPRKIRPPSSPPRVKKEEVSRDEKEKEGGEKRIRGSGDDKGLNESMDEDDKHAHESDSDGEKGSKGHRAPVSSSGEGKHDSDSDSDSDPGKTKNSGAGGAHVGKGNTDSESESESDKGSTSQTAGESFGKDTRKHVSESESESESGEGTRIDAGGAAFFGKHGHRSRENTHTHGHHSRGGGGF
ncbi:hypothetical protein T484DRAFT_1917394, partial [Baffinella frigidus]